MTHSYTRTYAKMMVSKDVFDEIKKMLFDTGYEDQIKIDKGNDGEILDMTGIALIEHPGKCTHATYDVGMEKGNCIMMICNATLVRCKCGAKWCLDHQPDPLVCPKCGNRS